MPYSHIFMLIAFILGILAGCGQTGALYMPSEEALAPTAVPAAPADDTEQNSSAS